MLTAWLAAAMKRAEYEELAGEALWYGRVLECPGAWATGESEESCSALLESVLEGWVELGVSQGHIIERDGDLYAQPAGGRMIDFKQGV